MILTETGPDPSALYFHGSSAERITEIEKPSFRHPFYVTPDLHYAMAFCTKAGSSTQWEGDTRRYNPASPDDNCVYVVTLSRSARFFDFRNMSGKSAAAFAAVVPDEVTDMATGRSGYGRRIMTDDLYEFCAELIARVIDQVYGLNGIAQAVGHAYGLNGKIRTFEQYKAAAEKKPGGFVADVYEYTAVVRWLVENSLDVSSEVHDVIAAIAKGLAKKFGYQGVIAGERDFNNQTGGAVTTNYAIGIWDPGAFDEMTVTPMRYGWLKRINPEFEKNRNSQTAGEKIRRYVGLYNAMTRT